MPNSMSVVPSLGCWVTLLGMVGDLDDHKISSGPNFNSVQNLRPLGSVETYNSYNGIVS